MLIAAGVAGVWYLVTLVILDPEIYFILPTPHVVIRDGIFDWDSLTRTLQSLWETARVTLVGFGLAILLGVFVATLMSQARWIERTLFPYAVVLQAVPIVAIVPLIGLWAGFEFRSKVIVTVIISIFPIITNTLFGLRSVSKEMYDLFNLHTEPSTFKTRITRLKKLNSHAAVPAFFAGLRISAGLAVVGTIVGEFFFRAGTATGLGRLILEIYRPQAGMGPEFYTAIFITCLLGVSIFWFTGLVSTYFTRHLHQVPEKGERTFHKESENIG